MGQKVNPQESVLSKTGTLNGMQKKILLTI